METCSLADILGDTDGVLPAVGEYHILSLDSEHPVAVSTLGDCELPDVLAERKPKGLSIVGKTETENIGIEKIIQNTLATPSLKYLILCGEDSVGHFSGQTILSLFEHGVNDRMRITGAKGKRPILANTTAEDVDAFRRQLEVVDMIGCTDLEKISQKIEDITAKEAALPKEQLGDNARDIYWTIIENNWVGEMSHAAYLGKELSAAQLSMQIGFKYVKDKA